LPDLSVIVPTYNEHDNIRPLVQALEETLAGMDFEIVFVDDDSTDGSSAEARAVAQQNARVRIVQRIGRRGLASAVVEGILATSSPWLAVMDGDLQHDERILPEMLRRLRDENLDLVIGSRHVDGGSMGHFASGRIRLSEAGRRLTRSIVHLDVSDPMSGFFVLRRGFFDEVAHELSSVGFKILLDLLATSRRPVRVGEVGYTFRTRCHGESKLDMVVGLEFLQLLLDKRLGGYIPISFFIFGLVGATGILLNLALMRLLLAAGLLLRPAVVVSSAVVIVFNYILNNRLTFRSRRLRGLAFWQGLAIFSLACALGLNANLYLTENLIRADVPLLSRHAFQRSMELLDQFAVCVGRATRLRGRPVGHARDVP